MVIELTCCVFVCAIQFLTWNLIAWLTDCISCCKVLGQANCAVRGAWVKAWGKKKR